MERATGPNPANRASTCFSSEVASRCACSMAFSVRMAAMMSRAFPFSPLAMGTDGAGPETSERVAGAAGGVMESAGASMAGPGRGKIAVETDWSGSESNRLGRCRDEFRCATCEGC